MPKEVPMLLALALALAHAGTLEVTVAVDDQVSTFAFDQVASCSDASTEVHGDGEWEVRARATGVEEGVVFVALDVEVDLSDKRTRRVVELAPQLKVKAGEPGKVVVGGPEGEVSVEVVAQDFEVDTSCTASSAERRSRTHRERRSSHEHERSRG